MKYRCLKKETKAQKNYGGRGILYDPKWETFEGFWEDMGDTWKEGLSLDRVDNNGNYCKENCRWATIKVQARNKRTNRYITYKGETKTLSAWAEELNIPRSAITARLDRFRWTIEEAFETPVKGAQTCQYTQ